MSSAIATALVSGNDPLPALAETAVKEAMLRAEIDIASSVLLFLSSEFAHQPHAAISAATRTAHCLQVTGCIGAGVFNEAGWRLDRPAAVAMVFGGGLALATAETGSPGPLLSLFPHTHFAHEWLDSPPRRFGGFFADASTGASEREGRVWSHGKLAERAELELRGGHFQIGVSTGINPLSPPLTITRCSEYDALELDGQPALATLLRELPVEWREAAEPPLHHLCALHISADDDAATALASGRYDVLPILATHRGDNSVTLGRMVRDGRLCWGARQPLSAERDMRQTLETLAGESPSAKAAIVFSCIGRGPWFYGDNSLRSEGGSDRDLAALVDRFPDLPIAGIYGSGQIVPGPWGNRVLTNTVLTALVVEDV